MWAPATDPMLVIIYHPFNYYAIRWYINAVRSPYVSVGHAMSIGVYSESRYQRHLRASHPQLSIFEQLLLISVMFQNSQEVHAKQ